jgi:hypothetical protein
MLHFDSVKAGYWHSIASGHGTLSANGRSASKVITYYDLLLLYLAIHHIKAEYILQYPRALKYVISTAL